jgi:hypothetical protein
MLGTMRMIFQTLYMPGIIPPFPAVESLRRDAKVATGEARILIMGPVVIEPFESLPGSLRQHPDTCQALISRNFAVNIHNAAIIASFHDTCVTHLSELDQGVRKHKGHAEAITARGRHMAEATYWALKNNEPYREPKGERIPSHTKR